MNSTHQSYNMKYKTKMVSTYILLLAAQLLVFQSNAYAFLYLSGSISNSTSNVPFQTYQSRYGSGSIGIDLGRYIRLQYTHSQEYAYSSGFKDPTSGTNSAMASSKTGADSTCESCIETQSMTHVIGNSIDLQIVLYEGQIFVPYVMGGAIIKAYEFETVENGEQFQNKFSPGPVPNLGAGLGIRLNREFTLKLAYLTSPGVVQNKGESMPRHVWDKKLTLGLTYQI